VLTRFARLTHKPRQAAMRRENAGYPNVRTTLRARKKMRIKNNFILIFLVNTLLIYSCRSTIHNDELTKYKKQETKYLVVYSEYPIKQTVLNSFDSIYDNLSDYLQNDLQMDIKKEKVTVAILPITNSVCNFKKQGTSTFCYPKNDIMYLLDAEHLPKEIIEKYGQPPENFLQNAFTHELTHILTIPKFHFNKSLQMKERLANYCSFFDFTKRPTVKLFDREQKKQIQDCYSSKRINDLKVGSIDKLKAKNSYEIPFFMLYLYETDKNQELITLIRSKSMNDFINKSKWTTEDTYKFIQWIEKM
jgi:hypothetical protein